MIEILDGILDRHKLDPGFLGISLNIVSLMIRYIVLSALFTVLLSSRAYAAQEGYVCHIDAFSRLQNDGTMNLDTTDPIVGKEFTVDRRSGEVLGRYISSNGFRTEVLDAGSKQQSFKVIAKNSFGFLHIMYLEIMEFSDQLSKPFLLVIGSVVYSGRCT